jgi:hypothetical protein
MANVSPRDRANKAFSLVLQKLPHGSGQVVAKEMGLTDKDLSEIKNKMMEPALLLLAHLGFKIVPVTAKCLDPVSYDFLTNLHQRIARKAPTLCWEDSESGSATMSGEL